MITYHIICNSPPLARMPPIRRVKMNILPIIAKRQMKIKKLSRQIDDLDLYDALTLENKIDAYVWLNFILVCSNVGLNPEKEELIENREK